ncbi:large polymerase protein [Isfahan virus]|uniref:RNA-directed RNA polymerase L n=1 Tax=Isfahan virus TaxID=290008 RepID=L_ISFV|nr:large polymerase protein [Isfahan virus]Q5K2K3.1 RecName: Full=RNA-directed RNA polymerase L; Short=Protein L; AltName: Full=Large structural protein; AltName: Full=Replicase; AltName: Full=Transcriptase; Includes: RecName: Full=RNA-directed RNA polymerase; Includes: RecName: Full=GTP phosphohydrolase; Includes: RecName: Full=GDP polyribonucleotidyltransferase; AltName: Full=PRNTase; Includes: RecName: Full=mRNA cap methyltransferase; AltName: Full=mRNA (guanine-N(7)-)-methyltransferase; Short=
MDEYSEEKWGDSDEESFGTGKYSDESRIRGLNSVDYNLNSPLIQDDLYYLMERVRGRPVPPIWKAKNWTETIHLVQESRLDYLPTQKLHSWYAEWLMEESHDSSQGLAFLKEVDKDSLETYEVVMSFLRGWCGGAPAYKKKEGRHIAKIGSLCQKFLDLHRVILIMNASTQMELSNLAETFQASSVSKKIITTPSMGKMEMSGQFALAYQQKVILDRNFLLMMKDVVIGRMQTLLSMVSRTDDKFSDGDISYLIKIYQLGDKIIQSLGNDGYELIKTIEPMCNLRLSDLAREYRPLIPEFPHFRQHIEGTVSELRKKTALIVDMFKMIDRTPGVDITLVIYGSFRHWGHPFIDYFAGLTKLNSQVTMGKQIDDEYVACLASDLARIVLTKEFNEKKRWSVNYNLVPQDHPFHEHIRDNTWPTPAVIQDFGDKWHELPLTQCFEIPDLIDPSIIYSDKSHSMNRQDVLNHVKRKPDQPIPSRKVLQTMIDTPATNWLEFLEEIDKNGLSDDDLVIGLKGKERELKIAGRFFSLMSWKLREYFVITEYLIKTHFVPLFHGLTMADDMTAVIKKMLESSSGQGLKDYSAVCIANHIDYEKWNNHQRKRSNEPIFKVMGQFLGFPNLISRTHEFFEKSLIYYNGRPDLMKVQDGRLVNTTKQLVCWEGQAGGLEGLRQKGWSILNLLVIQRESKIRNTAVKVLAQGDNQVICTQYKTKQHRNETELRSALTQMKLNNDAVMKAIESGTNKLGLLINQDETMQSADYLNYGKVPIFRGVIRGLETKRWSRVTCVTNDQLPTCANLMSSVSTNALTVAHFDVTPLNAMIQYNYFGNFSRLLLNMHDPAVRCSLFQLSQKHKIDLFSFEFKVGVLYLDPSIGGVCGTALSRFLIRGFPDPVTESISFWKVIYNNTQDNRLKKLCTAFGNPKIAQFRYSHIEKLLEDPTSLNISMGMSAANLLKSEIKKNLLRKRRTIGNSIVRDAVTYIHSEDEKIRSYLWSINPLFPRFLSEFKSGTFMGVASSVVSLFQNSRTIRNVFKDYMSSAIDELITKSEVNSLEHLCKYKGVRNFDQVWKCSASQADYLRRLSWGRKVLGTTIPHPLEMLGAGTIKNNSSTCCEHSGQDYISVFCPKGISNVLIERGPMAAYLGSKTSESTSILQPWEKESKIPIIKRATRLRDAIHWFVEPSSNLAKSILQNITALTGEEWGSSLEGFKRTGSALHRFTTSRMSHGGFCAQSPAALTRMMATTDTMSDYAKDNYDFMFQACLLFSQITTSVLLLETTISNTVHFHTRCINCVRKIEEPWLESPSVLQSKDVSNVLASWRNGGGSWGEQLHQLKPLKGDWEILTPAEKSYHVGRTLGFLFGDLTGQSSIRADDSSLFPLSIQKRLRGRGFLRGVLDGLVRASACQVIHRRSLTQLKRPANAVYGGLIFLIDKISASSTFINLCRDGPIREELSSIPHKIPTSYPTSNADLGLHIRNYFKFQCKSVELGKYQSDLEDLWLFSDLLSSGFAGPYALSSKVLKSLYKPSLSRRDRNNIRKLGALSRLLRSHENWSELHKEFLTSQLLLCQEEVRHACKFGIPKNVSAKSSMVWGKEAVSYVLDIPVEFTSQKQTKHLNACPRIQDPTISGLRLGQLPTGAHYKIRTILNAYNIKCRDVLCGGDGSGGMTAACLRYYSNSRAIFNSILEFDGSSMKGSSPDPPSALETVDQGMVRCVNATTCWENPSDLSQERTWDYFLHLKKSFNMKIDLIILDMEVRDFQISKLIEGNLRLKISKLLEKNGTLIYKTYGTIICSETSNVLTTLGPLFHSVYIVQTGYSSSFTSEVYVLFSKQKSFVDSPYVDWGSLQYNWEKLACFRNPRQEFKRALRIRSSRSLMGIPSSFLPDPLVNLETLLQISGVPSGVSHQLVTDVKSSGASGLSSAIGLLGLISHFTLDVTKLYVQEYRPPSDNRLIKMASAITGISYWISIAYHDQQLNQALTSVIKKSFPIRWGLINHRLHWSVSDRFHRSKDVRLSDCLAGIGNWIRGMELMKLPAGMFSHKEVNMILSKYIRGLNYHTISSRTGILEILKSQFSIIDRSLMTITTDNIQSSDWTD